MMDDTSDMMDYTSEMMDYTSDMMDDTSDMMDDTSDMMDDTSDMMDDTSAQEDYASDRMDYKPGETDDAPKSLYDDSRSSTNPLEASISAVSPIGTFSESRGFPEPIIDVLGSSARLSEPMKKHPETLGPFNDRELWDAFRDVLKKKSLRSISGHPLTKLELFKPNRDLAEYFDNIQRFGGVLGQGAFGAVYIAPADLTLIASPRNRRMSFQQFRRRMMKEGRYQDIQVPRKATEEEKAQVGEADVRKDYYEPKLAVKIQAPCKTSGGAFNDLRQLACEELEKGWGVQWLPHASKWHVSVPSTLVEGVINLHLNTLQEQTEHFLLGFGTYLHEKDGQPASYTVMERAVPFVGKVGGRVFYNFIESKKDIFVFLFQVLHALHVAQREYRFMHYDLHFGNIMIVRLQQPTTITYEIIRNDGAVVHYCLECEISVKIADFGLSRLETDSYIVENSPSAEVRSEKEYQPIYDMATVLGPPLAQLILWWNRVAEEKDADTVSTSEYIQILSEAFGGLFAETVATETELEDFLGKYYRRYRFNTLQNQLQGGKQETIPDVLDLLASFLGKPTFPEYETVKERPVHAPRQFIPPNPSLPSWLTYKMVRAPTEDAREMAVHVFSIDQTSAIEQGFSFVAPCCRMEPMDYLQRHRGIAINGSLTNRNIRGRLPYTPMGPMRATLVPPNAESVLFTGEKDFNEIYGDHIGYVTLKDGRVAVQKQRPKALGARSYDWFAGGLMLYQKGRQRPLDLQKVAENTPPGSSSFIFKCEPIRDSEAGGFDVQQQYAAETSWNAPLMPNCYHAKTSPMAKGSMQISRSMVVVSQSGELRFVSVERGRREGPTGATYTDMLKIAEEQFDDIRDAVLLESGKASNITLRFGEEMYSTSRVSDYLGSSILALVKPQ